MRRAGVACDAALTPPSAPGRAKPAAASVDRSRKVLRFMVADATPRWPYHRERSEPPYRSARRLRARLAYRGRRSQRGPDLRPPVNALRMKTNADLLGAPPLSRGLCAPVQDAVPGPERFSLRVVATGLANPWQMRWGPDGRIWVTERTGKRIVRVNPADGSRTVALTIADAVQRHAQDGVLGLALHPDLLKNRGADFVYVALTHDVDPGEAEVRRLTIRRYTYDPRTETLGQPHGRPGQSARR